MKRAAGVTGCGCTLTVVVLLTGLLLAACISTGEGTAADSPSHDKSQDTSEESNDAVLKSISPLESAIMPANPLGTGVSQAGAAKKKNLVEVDLGFIHAFLASISVIIVSELGDKTFFIAAILSMKNPRMAVFAGAMLALGLMTILSALLGFATTIIPRWFTYYVSCGLFAVFGIKMLREAYTMDANEAQEEYEEVQTELRKKEEEEKQQGAMVDAEAGITRTPQRRLLYALVSRVFLQSFTLTFLAEWGDRSQIATIILAARDEVIGVILGGTLGHALCTSLAVLGGRCIAQHISIKTVHLVGGLVFIIFALSAFVIEPDDHE